MKRAFLVFGILMLLCLIIGACAPITDGNSEDDTTTTNVSSSLSNPSAVPSRENDSSGDSTNVMDNIGSSTILGTSNSLSSADSASSSLFSSGNNATAQSQKTTSTAQTPKESNSTKTTTTTKTTSSPALELPDDNFTTTTNKRTEHIYNPDEEKNWIG